ncbi:MAG: hypothetical protein VB049_05050 [Candidatus Pelethousia sp.]|nr:hypothetical protein [Candidatus Pelethousia sp.]
MKIQEYLEARREAELRKAEEYRRMLAEQEAAVLTPIEEEPQA